MPEFIPENETDVAVNELFRTLIETGMDPIDALLQTIEAFGRDAAEHFIAHIRELVMGERLPPHE